MKEPEEPASEDDLTEQQEEAEQELDELDRKIDGLKERYEAGEDEED